MILTTRAIVLARGLGTRMRAADDTSALTEAQRRAADAGLKALFPINGRPFLDYVLSAVADAGIRQVALVVAPDHEVLSRWYTSQAPPTRLTVDFVVQAEPLGTANAVLAVEEWTEGRPFVSLNADNLYPVKVLQDLAALDEPGAPAFDRADLVESSNIPAERVQSFALLEQNERGYLTRVIEKPPTDLFFGEGRRMSISMNCWRLDRRIFDPCRDVAASQRGEFELPAAVDLAVQRGIPFRVIPARGRVLDLSRRADAGAVERLIGGELPRP